jgi:hypothetical protein
VASLFGFFFGGSFFSRWAFPPFSHFPGARASLILSSRFFLSFYADGPFCPRSFSHPVFQSNLFCRCRATPNTFILEFVIVIVIIGCFSGE